MLLPNKPELILVLDVNSSPSAKVCVELFEVLEPIYATYKVKFPLSESSANKTLSTTAVTPDDLPVICVPTNWSIYADTGTPWKVFWSWIL